MSTVTNSNMVQQQKMVEQLRREADCKRINVSEACEDLKAFCESNVREDTLITGIPPSPNPYKDKGKCALL